MRKILLLPLVLLVAGCHSVRELVLEGEQVLYVTRNGDGEGLVDIHFTSEGHHSFLNIK
ncbi:MAG: hypothetical protein K8T20_12320 [Planctomycetes bacterium]|nr:hypothetical protein [Planctomycetota bacterium]